MCIRRVCITLATAYHKITALEIKTIYVAFRYVGAHLQRPRRTELTFDGLVQSGFTEINARNFSRCVGNLNPLRPPASARPSLPHKLAGRLGFFYVLSTIGEMLTSLPVRITIRFHFDELF